MTHMYNVVNGDGEVEDNTPLLHDHEVVIHTHGNINDKNQQHSGGVDFSHGDSNAQISAKFAVWNLFNDILSPGTVALPFYIYQAGLGFGVVLIVLFGIITTYTLEEIYRLYYKIGKKNYPELCAHVLGRPGYAVVCFAIFCFNFGGLCGQLMYVKQHTRLSYHTLGKTHS
jgi:Transmembrane amino acid transporter protein